MVNGQTSTFNIKVFFSVDIYFKFLYSREACILLKSGMQLNEFSPVSLYDIINGWSLCCTNCCVLVPFVCDLSLTLDLAGIRYCRHGED